MLDAGLEIVKLRLKKKLEGSTKLLLVVSIVCPELFFFSIPIPPILTSSHPSVFPSSLPSPSRPPLHPFPHSFIDPYHIFSFLILPAFWKRLTNWKGSSGLKYYLLLYFPLNQPLPVRSTPVKVIKLQSS